jgi:hypothetical protein
LLDHGYTIARTNRALATLKTYAGLAFQAGVLPEAVYQQVVWSRPTIAREAAIANEEVRLGEEEDTSDY